jgi:hypothetical protein
VTGPDSLNFEVFTDEPLEALRERIKTECASLVRSQEQPELNDEISISVDQHSPASASVIFEYRSEAARDFCEWAIVPWLSRTFKTVRRPPLVDEQRS